MSYSLYILSNVPYNSKDYLEDNQQFLRKLLSKLGYVKNVAFYFCRVSSIGPCRTGDGWKAAKEGLGWSETHSRLHKVGAARLLRMRSVCLIKKDAQISILGEVDINIWLRHFCSFYLIAEEDHKE